MLFIRRNHNFGPQSSTPAGLNHRRRSSSQSKKSFENQRRMSMPENSIAYRPKSSSTSSGKQHKFSRQQSATAALFLAPVDVAMSLGGAGAANAVSVDPTGGGRRASTGSKASTLRSEREGSKESDNTSTPKELQQRKKKHSIKIDQLVAGYPAQYSPIITQCGGEKHRKCGPPADRPIKKRNYFQRQWQKIKQAITT